MTSNPAAAVRMLVIYSICVPLAALVGWLATDSLTFGSLGFFGIVAALICSPMIIRWHYQILIMGFGLPVYCFFLKGNPPLWQVTTLLSLGLAVVDRALNSEKRFMSVPLMTWPLLFTAAMAYATSQMTGGIGLQTLGGSTGGGKKYLAIFIGIGSYFALTSRFIPKEQRRKLITLYCLAGLPCFLGDIAPMLPAPLNYIGLLIPSANASVAAESGSIRLGALMGTANVIMNYFLIRYGLRGVLNLNHPFRLLLFIVMFFMMLLGGFRSALIAMGTVLALLFIFEKLYRTQLVLLVFFGVMLGATLAVTFADKLPKSMQRSMSFLPFVKVDESVMADADGSKKWREDMWADLWPKVPGYLLLGKGYSLTQQDYESMGHGTFAGANDAMDKSQTGLAVSGDYHNGPLSTLIPFGIWGGISYVWLSVAAMLVLYRNYRHSEPEMQTFNNFLLAFGIQSFTGYYLIIGSYSDTVGSWAKVAGLSIALNGGVLGAAMKTRVVQRINRMKMPQPA
jgi:hypothetical protein